MPKNQESDRLKIQAVCKLLDISPHTLRYWEKEFCEFIEPDRTQGGHRLYNDHHIRQLLEIKYLLKDELFSINGAKNRLRRRLESSHG